MTRGLKTFSLALAIAMLAGCGGTPTTPTASATTNDGSTVTDSSVGGDPGGALTDTSVLDSGLSTTVPDATATSSVGASSAATVPTGGFVLKGLVTDTTGRALVGASVSIGSQSKISANDGTFEFDGITDTSLKVNVTLNGYQAISDYDVTFTAAAPMAAKQFKLAADGTATTTTSTDTTTSTSTTSTGGGFALANSYVPTNFSSVSAMAVDGNIIYVLGMAKSLLLSHNTVVELDATSGAEVRRFNKTGLLSYIPTAATSLALDGGQLDVSNGSTTYAFSTDGTLIKKTSGGSTPNPKTAKDLDRSISYKLVSGSRVEATINGTTHAYVLPGALQAVAIGTDAAGDLIVLDTGKVSIQMYTFQP